MDFFSNKKTLPKHYKIKSKKLEDLQKDKKFLAKMRYFDPMEMTKVSVPIVEENKISQKDQNYSLKQEKLY